LLPLSEKCKVSETTLLNVVQQIRDTKSFNKKRNKIVTLGDSHARGCASEVQHNLDNTFEIHGTVKPGANLEGIVSSPTDATANLTKKGCSSNMGRNPGYKKKRIGKGAETDKKLHLKSEPDECDSNECSVQT